MSNPPAKFQLLHLHSSFNPGGKELRAARLMNAFGAEVAHRVVSGVPGELGAARMVDSAISVSYPIDFPPLSGKPAPARLRQLALRMRGCDLVLTYNWGAMDAVLAHRLFRSSLSLPPLIHHEDGFNRDECARLDWRRNWFRRLALPGTSALVVPSQKLERIALKVWHQPPARVRRIANGIALAGYARQAGAALELETDSGARLVKQPDELWLGTLAGLRLVKNLPRLVRVFAALPAAWRLVIGGEGSERAAILAEVNRLGLSRRVYLVGHLADPAPLLNLLDLFALSSDSEQFPLSVIEAMAAGLAVISPAVGDIAAMVAAPNRAWLSPAGDEIALAQSLVQAAANPAGRATIGAANQARARAEYDEAMMIAAYRACYGAALKLADFP